MRRDRRDPTTLILWPSHQLIFLSGIEAAGSEVVSSTSDQLCDAQALAALVVMRVRYNEREAAQTSTQRRYDRLVVGKT